jgi:hypothetical protein
MVNDGINEEDLEFRITTMSDSRPADYYFNCLDGSVFIDFNDYEGGLIQLVRISFDGYGCCNLHDEAIPMDEFDSRIFKNLTTTATPDQSLLRTIIKKTLSANKHLIWEDALKHYALI